MSTNTTYAEVLKVRIEAFKKSNSILFRKMAAQMEKKLNEIKEDKNND